MSVSKPILLSFAAGIATLALPSCGSIKSKPAADSGFNPKVSAVETRAKFLQEVWVAPAYRGKTLLGHFNSVHVTPVNIGFLASQSWWQQQTGKQSSLRQDAEMLASKMRSEFRKSLATTPGRKLSPAGAAGPGVLVIELALVELVPSKAYWNAAASTAGFVVPGAGFLSAAGRGSIAMEGRLVNGATGEIIATFKDRRSDKLAPVNLGSYAWYHGAEGNIADWAAECAEFLNSAPDQVVQRARSVTLKPW